MSGTLEGKVALVTGGGSGIGRATSLAFAREGARVVVADVNVEGGEETTAMIQAAGGEAAVVKADVSQTSEVEGMVSQVLKIYGGLNCAFNNAGISGTSRELGPLHTHECPEDLWDRIIGINLKGVWLCMKYEIPNMLLQGGGAIVNTSSVAGLVGIRNSSAYVASKHGVAGLTKTAALEYATEGIRINAVCPGYIDTPLLAPAFARDPEREPMVAARHAMGRLGTPEEVAEAVVWLCSDAASFVTGHTMTIDGGYVAQ